MKAMIFAAGLGSRMRPLTDHLPKPLLCVGGKPLIVWHLERLKRNGFSEIIINIAWRGNKIPEMLGSGEQFGVSIQYSDEQDEGLLETGGGIIKALPLLGPEPFLALNGDIWCDYEFTTRSPLSGGDLGHLLLVDNPQHNVTGDFLLDAGRVVDCKVSQEKLTYSGIAYFHPDLFKHCIYGKQSLVPILRGAMGDGLISGEHHCGVWQDIGTPERLSELDAALKNHPNGFK